MVLHTENLEAESDSQQPSRDAVRSKAWRQRHGVYLRELITASKMTVVDGDNQSYMAQLKTAYAHVWAQALAAAPAAMMRHDPSLSRAERRRISSVKNNRLCRHRHSLFLDGIEKELAARGMLPANLSEIKGLISE